MRHPGGMGWWPSRIGCTPSVAVSPLSGPGHFRPHLIWTEELPVMGEKSHDQATAKVRPEDGGFHRRPRVGGQGLKAQAGERAPHGKENQVRDGVEMVRNSGHFFRFGRDSRPQFRAWLRCCKRGVATWMVVGRKKILRFR